MSSNKIEEELSIHIKKALTADETAPKQKHVRACIVYTWDVKSSGSFWVVLKNQPVLGDEVITFKALITFHKVIKDGHPLVLRDAINERNWLDSLSRGISHMGNRGYASLIKAYVQYLGSKIAFHKIHPAFNGSFDYEEYISLRGVEDPNEGYEIISELMDLLNKIDTFQKFVFQNLRTGVNNECRIAALVPLVEESHGIYQFLLFMLTAMHQIIGSVEVLAPLRERFNTCHYGLFKFYYECSNIRYLTSLITIPKLSQNSPDFLAHGQPTKQPKKAQLSSSPTMGTAELQEQQRMFNEFEQQRLAKDRLDKERENEELLRRQQLERQQINFQQQQLDLQRQHELKRQQEEERLRYNQQQQNAMGQTESQMIQQRIMELQREVDAYKSQSYRDRNNLEESQMRMRALENQLSQLSLRANQAESSKSGELQQLQDELAQWKQKYEALAKLYAQLRKEHLDLLTKSKEVKDMNQKMADEHRREMDKLRNETRSKTAEFSDILIERNRLKDDVGRIKNQYEDELIRLRRELEESSLNLSNITRSKGDEVKSIIQKFTAEKDALIKDINSQRNTIEELSIQLVGANQKLQCLQTNNEEESAVLQVGLDQTLIAYDRLQKDSRETESKLLQQMNRLESEHLLQMNRMMDNIILSCIVKIDDSIYEFESPAHEGNQSASAEYVLSLLEKAQSTCVDFTQSFLHLIQGGDQVESINTSNAFAHAIVQLLHNAKGITRLAADDDTVDNFMSTVLSGASSARYFFTKLTSQNLGQIDQATRPSFILSLCEETQQNINLMSPHFEKLIVKEVATSISNVEDIGMLVESEMRNAAYAVQQAAKRIDEMILRDLNVHVDILDAAKALTAVISNLIMCATDSQFEIVNQSKGSTTTGAFYKKNNKWTEGLISAAKSVATATTYLVECADGLLNGTHSMEQLIVSAQEVSVSTTQLVSASRVKSIPYSKTQTRLEEAAVAVREATKLLVRAAKEASKTKAEQEILSELQNLGRHQYKVVEMEQQVKILEIEKSLQNARYKLGEIRKSGYDNDK